MFEVVAIWEGEFFSHESIDETDAREWFAQYAHLKGCTVRLWRLF